MNEVDLLKTGSGVKGMSRRELLRGASTVAIAGGLAKMPFAQSAVAGSSAAAEGKG